ncbi:MAG: septum formation inhibitor Maf [Solobacterium sp.]|nr:septum formation inhibitor Maf [Solobacterium sp.]
MKQIVLASKSPRRKELLEKCGVPFIIDVADIDETINENNPLADEIRELACRKAEAVLQRHGDAVVIGSDTIVTADGEVLGKPKDEEDAVRMLRKLSGRTHQVITGLAVVSAKRVWKAVSISDVEFQPLSEEEIIRYVRTGEPMDKAGAYAIQGIASRYVKEIRGDYYAIMGLPVSVLYEELKNIDLY